MDVFSSCGSFSMALWQIREWKFFLVATRELAQSSMWSTASVMVAGIVQVVLTITMNFFVI